MPVEIHGLVENADDQDAVLFFDVKERVTTGIVTAKELSGFRLMRSSHMRKFGDKPDGMPDRVEILPSLAFSEG